jgi:hypothetical protein
LAEKLAGHFLTPRYQHGLIFFCDNCPCRCSDHGILLIADSPQASHIFQVLHVPLSGCFESAKKYLRVDDEQDPEVDHAMCVVRSDEIATTSTTVTGPRRKPASGALREMARIISCQ